MSAVSKKELMNKVVTVTQDGSAQSLNGGESEFVGWLKVTGYVAGTFTAKIQHSPNNVDWIDLCAFAAKTANGVEAIQVNSATTHVLTYVRASVVAVTTPNANILIELHHKSK